MPPNQSDVAKAAGVSGATVSRVVNDDPAVTESTKKHVRAVMKKLGYTPSAAARQLALGRSDSIGVVITQIAPGFFASVMNGISITAQDRGYSTVFVVATVEDKARNIYRNMVEASRVDGLIILEPWIPDWLVEELETFSHPVVLIQQETDSKKVGSVTIDNRGGAREGMKHLLEKGYDDILVLRGPEKAQDAQEREAGCEEALKEAGASAHYIDGFFRADRALEAFREYRKTHDPPRAIFALNDTMAIALLRELHRDGVKVPDEVAVMGFDGIEAAEHLELTTIVTPVVEIGARATKLLLAKLDDPESPVQHVHLEGKLTVRATT